MNALKEEDRKNQEEKKLPEFLIDNETVKHNVFELDASRRFNHTPPEATTDPDMENESNTSSGSVSSFTAPQSRRSDDEDTESEPLPGHEPQGTCLPPSRLLE
jgi:hypothetical protein